MKENWEFFKWSDRKRQPRRRDLDVQRFILPQKAGSSLEELYLFQKTLSF